MREEVGSLSPISALSSRKVRHNEMRIDVLARLSIMIHAMLATVVYRPSMFTKSRFIKSVMS